MNFESYEQSKKATLQYHKTSRTYDDYRYSKDKKRFRDEHYAEVTLHEAARDELQEHYGDKPFLSLKKLREIEKQLQAKENEQYEGYCISRTRYREIQTISRNVESIMGIKLDINQDQVI